MTAKIQKHRLSKIKSRYTKKPTFLRRALPAIITVVLLSISYLTYRSILSPAGINEVLLSTGMLTGNTSTASNGSWTIPENQAPKNVPADCISWFDGCNTCRVKDGQLTGCTEKACKSDPLPSKCVQFSYEVVDPYEPIPQTTTTPLVQISTIPEGCISWFDGCNTCSVKDGQLTGCTKMACEKFNDTPNVGTPLGTGDGKVSPKKMTPIAQSDRRPAQCLAYVSTPDPNQFCTMEAGSCIGNDGSCVGYKDGCQKKQVCSSDQSAASKCAIVKPTPQPSVPANCISWFDGCNTCIVKDGKIAGCTMMSCKLNADSNSSAKCLTYKGDTSNTTCGMCPKVSRPPSDWCDGGKIINRGVDSCGCELGGECVMPPQASPESSPVITSFKAQTACGYTHFSSFRYTCSNGINYADEGGCQEFAMALFNARAKCKAGL